MNYSSTTNRLKMLGSVKAGFPTFVEEENDLITLEEYLTDNVHASFMIKIKNDDLSKIGILRGDLAIIERRKSVNVGDIVLALTGNRHMFHLAEQGTERVVLRSTHNYSYLVREETQVVGVVKGIIRKY